MQLPLKTRTFIDQLIATGDVVGIGIGGSRASGTANASSDIDIYVLTRNRIDPAFRQATVEQTVDDSINAEIAIPYWGDEDAFPIDDTWHEFAYFDAEWFFGEIDGVVNQHRSREGYSTSFVHTLVNMSTLYDPEGLIASWKRQVHIYPDALAEAIVTHNYPVSCVIHACYRNQIARAVELNDPVAANHRVAAFLACVFDITFASLRMWHPGEKRQLQYLHDRQDDLPTGFEEHIRAVLVANAPNRLADLMSAVDDVVTDVMRIVE